MSDATLTTEPVFQPEPGLLELIDQTTEQIKDIRRHIEADQAEIDRIDRETKVVKAETHALMDQVRTLLADLRKPI